MSFLTPGTHRCIWSLLCRNGCRLAAPGIALCWELGDRFLQRTQSCSISGGGEEWGQQPAPTGAGADTRSLLSLPSCPSAFAVTCTPQGCSWPQRLPSARLTRADEENDFCPGHPMRLRHCWPDSIFWAVSRSLAAEPRACSIPSSPCPQGPLDFSSCPFGL